MSQGTLEKGYVAEDFKHLAGLISGHKVNNFMTVINFGGALKAVLI